MILIIKYQNNTTTLFDTLEDNGAPQAIDALLINHILTSNFPIFSIDTEIAGGVAERKAGEFGLAFSFLQSDTSYSGDNLNNFFRGGTRAYKYLIIIQEGSTFFHGTFETSNLDFDFTFSQGRYDVSLLARDSIEELATYLDTLRSDFDIASNETMTFESYMQNHHLENFNVTFDGTFTEKVGETVYLSGYAYRNGISQATDLRSKTRLDTLKQLSKGLGFNYNLSVNITLQEIYQNQSNWYPRSFFNIDIRWLRTGGFILSSDMAIESTKVHKERILPKANKYLFIGYRNIISTAFPGFDEVDFTAVRGIMTDGTNIWQSDSVDNFNPIYAQYPFFYFPPSGGVAPDGNWVGDEQFAFFDRRYPYPDRPFIINRSDVNFVDLTLYNYTSLSGSTVPGSCAYARIFTTNIGFEPIQEFVINQYTRYILGSGKKVKEVKIPIESDTELNVFQHVRLTDDQGESTYYISKIKDLDLQNRDVVLELTQI